MILGLAIAMLVCALVPAVMFCINLRLYREPPAVTGAVPAVSVVIPARNEVAGIGDAVRSVLAQTGVELEVIVMDDGSDDGTDAVVLALAADDARVRLERAPVLPRGWNGKQHACWAGAHAARYPLLCFVDADVRLEPQCIARMAGFLGDRALVSGFPRQVTETFLEWMLLPLIHFVLLGFLPMAKMRKGTDPAYAAGCGQFILVRAANYFACGGHSGIKLTMHDGLRLPKLFRAAGFRTDLADLTNLAQCRMYTSAGQVWSGLAKNATEGLGSPGRIVPVSVLLVMGQVLPFVWLALLGGLLAFAVIHYHRQYIIGLNSLGAITVTTALLSVIIVYLPRVFAARRFRQDWRGALLHPLGILLLLAVQWYALARKAFGGAVSWRGRAYEGGCAVGGRIGRRQTPSAWPTLATMKPSRRWGTQGCGTIVPCCHPAGISGCSVQSRDRRMRWPTRWAFSSAGR